MMKMKILLALLLITSLNIKIHAETTDMAEQRHLGWTFNNGKDVEKDYKKAAYWFEKAALQGDMNSQKRLGYMYIKGEGVEQDYDQALYWLEKAALQGNKAATGSMGHLYKNKKKDYQKAIYWYKKAILLNHAGAATQLGHMHRDGWGFEKDVNKAVKWYTKAAKQGNHHGQRNLGLQYLKGNGVEQDYKKAHYWLNKAALQGNEKAYKDLINMQEKGQIPEDKIQDAVPTIDDIKADLKLQNYKNAFNNATFLANRGDPEASAELAIMYLKGLGVSINKNKAFDYATKSALGWDKKSVKGQILLGKFYLEGLGTKRNTTRAKDLFSKAAENGSKEAKVLLEKITKTPLSIQKAIKFYDTRDYGKAFKKFSKLANQNDVNAQQYLGDMYYRGDGVEKDYKKAIVWYQKAAVQDDGWSQYHLGEMYYYGRGVKKNTKKGLELIEQAAQDGWERAKIFLDNLLFDKKCDGASGTGFVVSQDGVVATAEHVTTSHGGCSCSKIYVDGVEASIIDGDKDTDTAILKVNTTYKDVARISDRPMKLAEEVVVLGWPLGKEYFGTISATKGHISGLTGNTKKYGEFRFSAPIQGGNSGGPIISELDGKVVGIVVSGIDSIDIQNLNFGKRTTILIEMMNKKNVPVTSKAIENDNIVEYYQKVTTYIQCSYDDK
jgi:TPR repeat protein